jgi:hypothetical protein
MNAAREGCYVPAAEPGPRAREQLMVLEISSHKVVVGIVQVPLGLAEGQALNASLDFITRLHGLACAVAGRAQRDVAIMPAGAADAADQASLHLDETARDHILFDLHQVGLGLRTALSDELVKQLRLKGFPAPGDKEDPALTFVHGDKAPIPWDVLYEYEEEPGPVDWRRFWGFRTPITHWIQVNRTEELGLRHGFFWAIADDLYFAGQEQESLIRRFARLPHCTLGEALRRHAEKELRDRQPAPPRPARPDDGAAEPGKWFCRFLNQLEADRRDLWKRQALVKIFGDERAREDVILHFACHCKTQDRSSFLSQLHMTVAGEPVTLDVALMAAFLRREIRSHRESGPLVFLNACGSGQVTSAEPPGFPETWIKKQGALAVVATLCPVPDAFAFAFARKFYEFLFGEGEAGAPAPGRRGYLAEALLATRRYVMEHYNNPLGLAYVLYATQGAYIVPHGPPPGGSG